MNLETLNRYQDEGWLIKQTHPTLPLTIWNYSQNTQYEGKWDAITLQCRGLVTDDKGNVIARPFRKFFNIEEGKHTPTEEFDVYEKMDGSLGILFMYGGEWIFASRGSFTSDQCIRGKELLSKYNLDLLSAGYTYLFEIIYDENRIVCKYDFEDIVLLGGIETTDGNEIDIHNEYYTSNFNVVKKYDGISDYSTLKGMVNDNAEGFVVRFSNGDRMKVKGEEYIRLHRIMTNVSTTSIWECLSNGTSMESLLINVPDEFYHKIKEVETSLKDEFSKIESVCGNHFSELVSMGYGAHNRKEFAENALRSKYASILFSMLDGRDYSSTIWKFVKPKYIKL